MSVNMTLKNVPEEVYRRLKLAAEQNRRSLNSEAILCLEMMLNLHESQPEERLSRARKIREALPAGRFEAAEIESLKKQGRP